MTARIAARSRLSVTTGDEKEANGQRTNNKTYRRKPEIWRSFGGTKKRYTKLVNNGINWPIARRCAALERLVE